MEVVKIGWVSGQDGLRMQIRSREGEEYGTYRGSVTAKSWVNNDIEM